MNWVLKDIKLVYLIVYKAKGKEKYALSWRRWGKTGGEKKLCSVSEVCTRSSNYHEVIVEENIGISLSSFWNLFVFKVFSFKGSLTWYPFLWKSPSSWRNFMHPYRRVKKLWQSCLKTWQLSAGIQTQFSMFPMKTKIWCLYLIYTFSYRCSFFFFFFFRSWMSVCVCVYVLS